MIEGGKKVTSKAGVTLCLGQVMSGTYLHTRDSRVSTLLFFICILGRLNLIVLPCADIDYNKAMLSGLLVEDWTRQFLEIPVGE